MPRKSSVRQGQIAIQTGRHWQLEPCGGRGKEMAVTGDELLPPTLKPGTSLTLVDPTKYKSGRGG